MADEVQEIPEHGRAGVAFLGVEFRDGVGLIASVFGGVIGAVLVHWSLFIILPGLGWAGTKLFLEWKRAQMDGYLAMTLFRFGLKKLTSAFKHRRTIYVGDSAVANPALTDELDAITKRAMTTGDH